MNIIYYYQTFVGLEKLKNKGDTTNIIISSIHFGNDKIYLNDNEPDDSKFNKLWEEIETLPGEDIHVSCMIGGAGGAYKELFSNFDLYYQKLLNFLVSKPLIQGINLDIEEVVSLENIKKLIDNIRSDFGEDFEITMAPVSSAMESDIPGMGGFVYKDLYNSKEGKMINYFNCQCYESFSLQTCEKIINNGYPEEKIVMGMISGQFSDDSFTKEVHKIKEKYPDIRGFYDWEYLDAPPNKNDPSEWAKLIKSA
jgi:hypothetical protein